MRLFVSTIALFAISAPALVGCMAASDEDTMEAAQAQQQASGPAIQQQPLAPVQPIQCAPPSTEYPHTDYTGITVPGSTSTAPDYQGPTYQGPTITGPTYKKPTYQQGSVPTVGAPTYQAPTYPGPVFQGPVYQAPTYEGPTYMAPVYLAPTYEQGATLLSAPLLPCQPVVPVPQPSPCAPIGPGVGQL